MDIYDISVTNFNGVPNQFIILSKFGTLFQSYKSPIALIDWVNKKITIYPDYKHSKITSKYRDMFFVTRGMAELASTEALENAIENGCWRDYKIIKKDNEWGI